MIRLLLIVQLSNLLESIIHCEITKVKPISTIKKICYLSFAILSTSLPLHSWAELLPKWEAGAGLAVINFPDYRGSNERETYVLPIPYFVYRGDFLKVDDQRVRGLFFKNDHAEMDVSINGSVPVQSKNNQARQGMPDLDPTLEIGPSLNFFLYRSADNKRKVDLRLPLRAVIASDFSEVRSVGWIFQPNINIDHVLKNGWKLGMLAGPIFSNRRHHQYFYGVEEAYAKAERPSYNAGGGYAGSQILMALSKRYRDFWVGSFIKWDTLQGAVYEDSPLVKTKQHFTGGFAISWVFGQSNVMVESKK